MPRHPLSESLRRCRTVVFPSIWGNLSHSNSLYREGRVPREANEFNELSLTRALDGGPGCACGGGPARRSTEPVRPVRDVQVGRGGGIPPSRPVVGRESPRLDCMAQPPTPERCRVTPLVRGIDSPRGELPPRVPYHAERCVTTTPAVHAPLSSLHLLTYPREGWAANSDPPISGYPPSLYSEFESIHPGQGDRKSGEGATLAICLGT